MSKRCPISGIETKCTDNNCDACQADEKRYSVKAYLEKSMRGLIVSLETNDYIEVEEFIWEHCQEGLNCELVDKERDTVHYAYAERFTENTNEVSELITKERR